ncbi:hypothetical protein RND71_006679 [Anisodus tanguticus]|uniref:Dirigent protein n=1 Tax=Anisodus tanguticus TaxID=243964 RepID=A0AAE1STT9_9SOLA|nr:hypothetical protein RND71_006679 [Anisodus tanguticus]
MKERKGAPITKFRERGQVEGLSAAVAGGAIAVTRTVTNPAVSGQVPFAKPNGAVLAVDNGVPTNNANSGIISNNNIPFLTGLSGTTFNLINQNNNGIIGGGNGLPAINLQQLGSGISFPKLMFGTLTVFDDELTEGHELNSGLIGKAQGFYVASSEDGLSQTMAFTVLFKSGSYADSLSFFGVHRMGVSESHLAVMAGTVKYVNAKGFATVKNFPLLIRCAYDWFCHNYSLNPVSLSGTGLAVTVHSCHFRFSMSYEFIGTLDVALQASL